MSLFGMMRTSVSGMNAQASRLGTVSDNIANSGTTGYKRSSTEFSTLVLASGGSDYNSGGVESKIRYSITQQGALEYTSSNSDLALQGGGFFIVRDPSGANLMTRAGSFIPDKDGNLVNTAGLTLMGYNYTSGAPAPVVNGFGGLVPINVNQYSLSSTPTTKGAFTANVDSGAAISTAALPSANLATSAYTNKSSLVVYDNLGNAKTIDFYYTKTAANKWEVAAFDNSAATAGTGFPYTGGPLGTTTLDFDPANGNLLSTSSKEINFTVPGGQAVKIDLSTMTQKAIAFTVSSATCNGSKPSLVDSVAIDADGIVSAKYKDGSTTKLFRLALATVASPDLLKPVTGNAYQQSDESGVITTGFANNGSFGKIVSGALESSNVDMASELTQMIESQRSYTANSKVFQTGGDLMDVLVNLKR
jgi:flagellar hook protein FlgE